MMLFVNCYVLLFCLSDVTCVTLVCVYCLITVCMFFLGNVYLQPAAVGASCGLWLHDLPDAPGTGRSFAFAARDTWNEGGLVLRASCWSVFVRLEIGTMPPCSCILFTKVAFCTVYFSADMSRNDWPSSDPKAITFGGQDQKKTS